MKCIPVIFLLSLNFPFLALAHQDRIIPIAEDGALSGIPSEFGPARIKIEFSTAPKDLPVRSVTLTLGSTTMRLPHCVTTLLPSRRFKEVRASASWYHDESTLPYYLQVEFFDATYNPGFWANNGVSLLFNLRSARLMEATAKEVVDEGRTLKPTPIDFDARCGKTVLEQFADPKATPKTNGGRGAK